MTDFFTPISNTKPYFKAALEGFAGTGKTYTGALIARGIWQRIGSKKPIVIFDTERASKFLKPMFAAAGIQVLVKESRTLTDLMTAMKLCREGASDILIIDSISHVWENFLEAYKEKVKRTRLEFQDWGMIKPTWKAQFADPFVNDPYHTIMCGRAGYEYETEVTQLDDGRKKKEIFKSGIKMKVEGETAYEPDILVLMERFEEILGDNKKVYREATIIKDRSTIIDGKTFRFAAGDPPEKAWECFAPAIEAMLADPGTVFSTSNANDALLFQTEEDKMKWRKERDRWVEEIEGLLVSAFPGQSAAEKKNKTDLIEFAFATRSWTAIQGKKVEELQAGYEKILSKLIAEGVVEKKVGMPTSQQRDKLRDLLNKANIHGLERVEIDNQFIAITNSDVFAEEFEKLEADINMRKAKSEPDIDGVAVGSPSLALK